MEIFPSHKYHTYFYYKLYMIGWPETRTFKVKSISDLRLMDNLNRLVWCSCRSSGIRSSMFNQFCLICSLIWLSSSTFCSLISLGIFWIGSPLWIRRIELPADFRAFIAVPQSINFQSVRIFLNHGSVRKWAHYTHYYISKWIER